MEIGSDGFRRTRAPGRLCMVEDAAVPCDVLLDGDTLESRHDWASWPEHPPGWLSAPAQDSPLPDHACLLVARLSVSIWAMDRLPGGALAARVAQTLQARLARTWPFPATESALLNWAEKYNLPTDDLPAPALSGSEPLWIGLVVERRPAFGDVVTLFAPLSDGPRAPGDSRVFQWAMEPKITTQRQTRPKAVDDVLLAVERNLHDWYAKELAQKKLPSGGRKPGNTSYTRQEFAVTYPVSRERAAANARKRRQKLTKADIASEMGISTRTLHRYLGGDFGRTG